MINIFQKAAFCCLFFISVISIQAQTSFTEWMTIFDEATGEPIEGVVLSISCEGQSNTFFSDKDGNVMITICKNDLVISFDHPNYHERREFKTLPETVSLKALPAIISAVEIKASYVSQSRVLMKQVYQGSAVSLIAADRIQSTDKTSLLNTLNTVPGIKMDERGYGGSRRISIRGSFVRSPFAVRNLGLYYNHIPLNSPDGSSPIELIDADEVGNMQVIKGPAGSVYGSGNGGVLLVAPAIPSGYGTNISNRFTVGSYGLIRNYTSASYHKNNNWIKASFVHQELEGYREQEFNKKNQALIQGNIYVNNKLSYFAMYQHYEGNWGLPGALNAAEVEDDPQQARTYSEKINASLDRTRDLIALKQDYVFRNRILSRTSIYLSKYEKTNPYGTSEFFNGLKKEDGFGYGGRSSLAWWKNDGDFTMDASIGIEWQEEKGNFDEYPNSVANPSDDLRYSNETTFRTSLVFASAKISYKGFSLAPSASLNNYSVSNTGYSFVLDTTLNENYNAPAEVLLGLSLSKVRKNTQVILALNQGRSTPGLFELVDVETGILNTSLKAEKGLNTELTVRQFSTNQRTFIELSIYEFKLEESIIPEISDLEQISYSNGGSAVHRGLEAAFNHRFEFTDDSFIEQVSFRTAGALQNFKNTSDQDYSIPGVPLATFSSGLNILFGRTLSIDINHYWSDKMPLNDANTDYLNAYHLLNTKLTWEKRIKSFKLDVFVGLNNVTDSKYSSFPAVNAAFSRYYNPSPGMNIFGGIGLSYHIN